MFAGSGLIPAASPVANTKGDREWQIGGIAMSVVIRFTAKEEAKALPIILRHSPGVILANRTYALSEQVVALLRTENIRFTEISRKSKLSARSLRCVPF
jgi:hypothetical protein